MNEARVRVLGSGRYLTLLDDAGWEYVTRPNIKGVVVIVAVTEDDKLLLVEQHRPAVGRKVIELPAGLVGDIDVGESLSLAAERELIEETGFEAREMVALAEGPVAVGVSDETVSFFHARATQAGGDGRRRRQRGDHRPTRCRCRSCAASWPTAPRRAWPSIPKIYAGLFLVGVHLPA